MSNVNFSNFGRALLVRGYFMIFSMILGLLYSLGPFLSYIFPFYGTIYSILIFITTGFSIIGIVISLIILIYTKRLHDAENHPYLGKFYTFTLTAFILQIFAMLYPMLQNIIVGLITHSSSLRDTLISIIITGIISLIVLSMTISAWSNFLRYSMVRHFNPNVTKGSNLIKIGSILSIFSTIISLSGSLLGILMIMSGFPYNSLIIVLNYVILYGSILFDLIVPILLIIGYLQVGRSIQTVSISLSTEPTLGDSITYTTSHQITTKNRKICSNCGESVLNDAAFCPYCGNSL